MSNSKTFLKYTKEYYTHLFDTLGQDRRAAHALAQEVSQNIPEARERQVYKMLQPFAHFDCGPQLKFLVNKHMIEPLLSDNYEKMMFPNQYSMFFMNYGLYFFDEEQRRNNQQGKVNAGEEVEKKKYFSPFLKLKYILQTFHKESLVQANPDVIIFIIYTYLLNSNRDYEMIDYLLDHLTKTLSEADLSKMHQTRSATLLKILVYHRIKNGATQFEEYEKMVRQVSSSQRKPHLENQGDGERSHAVSKENIFVRDVLNEVLGKDESQFQEEHYMDDALCISDFYVPKARLCIEINGKQKFYPYTTRFNNITNFKHKMVLSHNHNILHLNSWVLQGMINNPDGKSNLKNLLTKTLGTYEEKVKQSQGSTPQQ